MKLTVDRFRPQNDLVLIEMLTEELELEGGIVLAEPANPDFRQAKVIKPGTGTYTITGRLVKPRVAEGDIVLIPGNLEKTLRKVHIEDKDYLLINESAILAVI